MCGRAYETYTEEELAMRYLNEKRKRDPLGLKPNFNMCPTQLSPVVLVRDGERTIELFRWGLVPFWAKDIKSASKYSLINCVGEEITEKRTYKQAFERRRCIVPVSGFFEWKRPEGTKGAKRPYVIRLKETPIMSLAGVWEHWESKETEETVDSFSIITTKANALVGKIHNRMPVILAPDQEEEWLDPKNTDVKKLQKLLTSYPAKSMETYEISPLVNSPKNNRPEVLEPISASNQ